MIIFAILLAFLVGALTAKSVQRERLAYQIELAKYSVNRLEVLDKQEINSIIDDIKNIP